MNKIQKTVNEMSVWVFATVVLAIMVASSVIAFLVFMSPVPILGLGIVAIQLSIIPIALYLQYKRVKQRG